MYSVALFWFVIMLPSAILSLLAPARCIGFSGSLAPAPASLATLAQLVNALPAGISIIVGDAPGIDQQVRQLIPSARIFFASAFGSGRGAFAARSIACVRAVAAARGVWASFPASLAPVGLRPSSSASACFAGYGSGTWASLAFALGLGLSAIIFLPSDVAAPAGWPLSPVGRGWFVAQPPAQQLALF
jgi:hypothetical protein